MDENQFKCFIHKGILENPYQCTNMNCQKIFCKDCIVNYSGNLCPNCHTEKKIAPHTGLFLKIKTKYKKCEKCEKYFEQSEIDQHLKNCNINIIKCCFCNFIGEKKFFFEHYIKKHGDILIDKSEKNNIIINNNNYKNNIINNNNNINVNDQIINNNESVIANTLNNPENKFFYCNNLKNFKCNCCKDNICKKNNCMCSNCQKKNCVNFGYGKNTLINKYGNLSYFHSGKFSCNNCDVTHEICPGCESLFENRIHYLDNETYNIIQKMIDFNLNLK